MNLFKYFDNKKMNLEKGYKNQYLSLIARKINNESDHWDFRSMWFLKGILLSKRMPVDYELSTLIEMGDENRSDLLNAYIYNLPGIKRHIEMKNKLETDFANQQHMFALRNLEGVFKHNKGDVKFITSENKSFLKYKKNLIEVIIEKIDNNIVIDLNSIKFKMEYPYESREIIKIKEYLKIYEEIKAENPDIENDDLNCLINAMLIN